MRGWPARRQSAFHTAHKYLSRPQAKNARSVFNYRNHSRRSNTISVSHRRRKHSDKNAVSGRRSWSSLFMSLFNNFNPIAFYNLEKNQKYFLTQQIIPLVRDTKLKLGNEK